MRPEQKVDANDFQVNSAITGTQAMLASRALLMEVL